MTTGTVAFICGSANAWKVAIPSDPSAAIQLRKVLLEIQSDSIHGYHLVMSPEGCFTADTWHATLDDATDTAHRLLDVRPEAWA